MVKRKVITTLLATPVSLLLIFSMFFGEWRHPLELFPMTILYSLLVSPIIIAYAVPVTFFSDYVSKRFSNQFRMVVAFLIHIGFAVLYGFIFPMSMNFSLLNQDMDGAFLFAPLVAIIFWIIDEASRKEPLNCCLFSSCRLSIK